MELKLWGIDESKKRCRIWRNESSVLNMCRKDLWKVEVVLMVLQAWRQWMGRGVVVADRVMHSDVAVGTVKPTSYLLLPPHLSPLAKQQHQGYLPPSYKCGHSNWGGKATSRKNRHQFFFFLISLFLTLYHLSRVMTGDITHRLGNEESQIQGECTT